MCWMPSALPIDTAITRPRALNEPVGSRPSSLTMISPPPNFRASFGRRISGVMTSPRLTMSLHLRAGESVAHEKRFAGPGEIVNLVGGIPITVKRAFQMGYERRPFDGQIVVVFHSFALSSVSRPSLRAARSNPEVHPRDTSGLLRRYAPRNDGSNIQHTPIGVEHRFLHHLRESRV